MVGSSWVPPGLRVVRLMGVLIMPERRCELTKSVAAPFSGVEAVLVAMGDTVSMCSGSAVLQADY
jgi:hypothetical protein